MRISSGVVALLAAVVLAACGGGGGGGGSSSNSTTGSGGTGTGGSGSLASNQVAVTAGPGIGNFANLLTTSVTICITGTSTCQTIDNVQVDTGSYGLRLLQSAISIAIPENNDPVTSSPAAECAQFGDGFIWGTISTVDIKLNGETATGVPIQVITATNSAPAVPAGCTSTLGQDENTTALLGANGILGVGFAVQDCGNGCLAPGNNVYWSCPGNAGCTSQAMPLANQVANPVAFFPTDNNGVIVTMPSVSASTGQASATGTLTFGLATQTNNTLSGMSVIPADQTGGFTATFNATAYPESFFDSGSSILFFNSGVFTACTGAAGNPINNYYCPGTQASPGSATFDAEVASVPASVGSGTLNFTVGNAWYLFGQNGSSEAFNDLAGPAGSVSYFDFGLSAFFGHSVATAIANGGTTAGNPTPFYGYK